MTFEETLQERIDSRTKPKGSLGQLERIAYKVGLIQHSVTPQLIDPVLLVMAADHGIVEEGVSPCPKEITWQQCINFVSGGGACSVLARQNGFRLRVIDVGVDYDFPEACRIESAKVMHGTRNMLHEPAMTTEECAEAMMIGAQCVAQEAERGTNVIAFGEMGIGNTSPATLILHKITGRSIASIIGPGSGLRGSGLEHKTKVLEAVAARYNPQSPMELLSQMGGLEIAAICGGVLEAYKRGMLILADGVIATSAFMVAHEMEPRIVDNVLFTHTSEEPGHQAMIDYLGGEAILSLGMRLGEGTGALVAYPIIQSAVAFMNNMRGFADAAVYRVDK